MGIPGEENPKETPGYSTERKEAVLKMLPLNLKTILQVCKLSGRDEFRGCPAQLVKSDPAVRSFAPGGEQHLAKVEPGGQLQETDQPHRQGNTRSPRKNARPQKRCTAINQAYSRDII